MIGTGTIVNILAIACGTTVGLKIKGGLQDRFKKTIMQSIGLATFFIGITGVIEGMVSIHNNQIAINHTMLMILSLVIGGLIGEAINIEKKLENFGEFFKNKFKVKEDGDNKFVEGFVTASLLYCVGAMAIVGALEDGLTGDPSTLFAKSILDLVAAVIFAAALGVGVYLSCLSVAIYQGSITILASFIKPYMNETLISQMSFIGSALIFAIGFNLIFDSKIKIGNMIPAMIIPIFAQVLQYFF